MAALTCTRPHSLLAYARAATLLAAAAALLLAFLSAWAGETDAREPARRTLSLDDGRERSYVVYGPEPGGDVVLVLHGSGGNATPRRSMTVPNLRTDNANRRVHQNG